LLDQEKETTFDHSMCRQNYSSEQRDSAKKTAKINPTCGITAGNSASTKFLKRLGLHLLKITVSRIETKPKATEPMPEEAKGL
jgi:phosphomannomutase